MVEIANIKDQLELDRVERWASRSSPAATSADYLCAVARGLIQFVCVRRPSAASTARSPPGASRSTPARCMYRRDPALHRGRRDRAHDADVRPLGEQAAPRVAQAHLAAALRGPGPPPPGGRKARCAADAGLYQQRAHRHRPVPDQGDQGQEEDREPRVGAPQAGAPRDRPVAPAAVPQDARHPGLRRLGDHGRRAPRFAARRGGQDGPGARRAQEVVEQELHGDRRGRRALRRAGQPPAPRPHAEEEQAAGLSRPPHRPRGDLLARGRQELPHRPRGEPGQPRGSGRRGLRQGQGAAHGVHQRGLPQAVEADRGVAGRPATGRPAWPGRPGRRGLVGGAGLGSGVRAGLGARDPAADQQLVLAEGRRLQHLALDEGLDLLADVLFVEPDVAGGPRRELVDVEARASKGVAAELGGELVERVHDKVLAVAAEGALQQLVGPAQPVRQQLDDLAGKVGVLFQRGIEEGVVEHQHLGGADGGRRGGAGLFVDDGHLAEDVAPGERDQGLGRRSRHGLGDLHLAVDDDEHLLARLALAKDHGAGREVPHVLAVNILADAHAYPPMTALTSETSTSWTRVRQISSCRTNRSPPPRLFLSRPMASSRAAGSRPSTRVRNP